MKLGLITTGHGPRTAYEDYFSGLARSLGLQIEVISEHILDPLSWEEIQPHLAKEGQPVLGAHVHVPGATGNRLGEGWDHVYVDLEWAYQWFQRAIDRLQERGAQGIVFCCATQFTPDQFKATVPVIRPCDVTMQLIAGMVQAQQGERLRLGLMSSIGHAEQDQALFRGQSFSDQIELKYQGFEGDILAQAPALTDFAPQLVVVWSFGLGTAASDPDRLAGKLEKLFGCPVIMPHRLAALQALAVLPVDFDDRHFCQK